MSEKTTIQIDTDLRDTLASMGFKKDSFNAIIKRLLDIAHKVESNHRPTNPTGDMKQAVVDKHGKATITRTLAGKVIEWREKK